MAKVQVVLLVVLECAYCPFAALQKSKEASGGAGASAAFLQSTASWPSICFPWMKF